MPITSPRADIQPTVITEDCGMLVLTRLRNQQIAIGDDVVITILEIRGNKVRVGITAPNDVNVHRMEVYEENQRLAELRATLGREAGPDQG